MARPEGVEPPTAWFVVSKLFANFLFLNRITGTPILHNNAQPCTTETRKTPARGSQLLCLRYRYSIIIMVLEVSRDALSRVVDRIAK